LYFGFLYQWSLFIIIINIISYLQCLSGINRFNILDMYCKDDSTKNHEGPLSRSLTQKFESSLNSHLTELDRRCQVISGYLKCTLKLFVHHGSNLISPFLHYCRYMVFSLQLNGPMMRVFANRCTFERFDIIYYSSLCSVESKLHQNWQKSTLVYVQL